MLNVLTTLIYLTLFSLGSQEHSSGTQSMHISLPGHKNRFKCVKYVTKIDIRSGKLTHQ